MHRPAGPVSERNTHYNERVKLAKLAAESVSDDELEAKALDTIVGEIVATHAARPVVALFDDRYSKTRESPPNMSEPPTPAKPLIFELHIPCRGAVGALMDVPGRVLSSLYSHGDESEVIIGAELNFENDWTSDDLGDLIEAWTESLTQTIKSANNEVQRKRDELEAAVVESVEPRWSRIRRLRTALRDLHIPLAPIAHSSPVIPVEPRPLNLSQVEKRAASGAPEWRLAEDLAEGVMSTIHGFSNALERLPITADHLLGEDEESLRDVLLFVLNANYRGLATGETFIGAGKADLLLRWKDRDAFVAECKIWKGPAALTAGVTQLLTRYTLWRHTRVAIILFIREPRKATTTIDAARRALAEHERTLSVRESQDPYGRSDFTVEGSGDERRPAELSLVPVVIPRSSESNAKG